MKLTCFNAYHQGDTLWDIHFFNKLATAIPGIEIDYRCGEKYISQAKDFLLTPGIKITSLESASLVGVPATDMWIGTTLSRSGRPVCYLTEYVTHYKRLCDVWKLPWAVWDKQHMLCDHPKLVNENAMTQDWDTLVINSTPMSGQFPHDPTQFDDLIRKLPGKVITTKKVDHIPRTTDHNLSLMQIGQVSLRSSRIIGIHTSPMLPCINIHNTSKRILVLDRTHGFDLPNWKRLSSLDELKKELC